MTTSSTNEPVDASPVIDVPMRLPANKRAEAVAAAIQERPDNMPAPGGPLSLATAKKLWKPGRTLRIRFIDPGVSDERKQLTFDVANEWTQYANLTFELSDDIDAELRVSFLRPGCWSWIGTDAKQVDLHEPTINLSVMSEPALRPDYRRYILHEFGHAIGCIHEHQTPIAGIDWNKPVVYKYYWDNFRWPQDKVDLNVLDVLSEDETNHSDDFDPDSIMVYPILAEHTNDGYQVDWGLDLSKQDKAFIAEVYPAQ